MRLPRPVPHHAVPPDAAVPGPVRRRRPRPSWPTSMWSRPARSPGWPTRRSPRGRRPGADLQPRRARGPAAGDDRAARRPATTFLYLLLDPNGERIWGNIAAIPHRPVRRAQHRLDAASRVDAPGPGGAVSQRLARGERQKLTGGEVLFVGADVSERRGLCAAASCAPCGAPAPWWWCWAWPAGSWSAATSADRSPQLNAVVAAVRGGDLRARVALRGSGDEFDELAAGLNDMLDRLERSIGGLRHAGDAIAHDLRSPLTRLRTRLEVALLDVEAGKGDPTAALVQALEDADGVLRTFAAVLAIARLQAAGRGARPDPVRSQPAGRRHRRALPAAGRGAGAGIHRRTGRGPERARQPGVHRPGHGQHPGQRGQVQRRRAGR